MIMHAVSAVLSVNYFIIIVIKGHSPRMIIIHIFFLCVCVLYFQIKITITVKFFWPCKQFFVWKVVIIIMCKVKWVGEGCSFCLD